MDRHGDTVDFLFSAKRDIAAARRFLERAIGLHGLPDKITIDKSGANIAEIESVIADTGAPGSVTSVQIPEQYRRTGSSIHQALHPAHAGLQIISLCSHCLDGNRNHASDSQGTVTQPTRPNSVRCRAVLQFGLLIQTNRPLPLPDFSYRDRTPFLAKVQFTKHARLNAVATCSCSLVVICGYSGKTIQRSCAISECGSGSDNGTSR